MRSLVLAAAALAIAGPATAMPQQPPRDAAAKQARLDAIEREIGKILAQQVKRRDPDWKLQRLLALRREREQLTFTTPATAN